MSLPTRPPVARGGGEPVAVKEALARELAARRALQRERAERARLAEIDQALGNPCPECGPANPLVREHGHHRGFVPLVEPRTTYRCASTARLRATGGLRDPATWRLEQQAALAYRPCLACNRARWEAWQAGQLAAKPTPAHRERAERDMHDWLR